MDPMTLLTGPSGSQGGGPKLDVASKTQASSALNSAASYYDQKAGDAQTGSFIVGGSQGISHQTILILSVAVVVALFLLKK